VKKDKKICRAGNKHQTKHWQFSYTYHACMCRVLTSVQPLFSVAYVFIVHHV